MDMMQLDSILTSEDISGCADLFVSVFNAEPWNEHWDKDSACSRLHDFFQSPRFIGYLVKVGGAVKGFVLGNIELFNQEQHLNLKEICVASSTQRQGLGTMLMKILEERCKQGNINQIYLLTMRAGIAEQFYIKRGFVTSQRMILMSKQLNRISVM
jgi:aminoglycoside 6'-N-acetyltransferase I